MQEGHTIIATSLVKKNAIMLLSNLDKSLQICFYKCILLPSQINHFLQNVINWCTRFTILPDMTGNNQSCTWLKIIYNQNDK